MDAPLITPLQENVLQQLKQKRIEALEIYLKISLSRKGFLVQSKFMESQSSKNKINSFSFRRTEIHKKIFILNKCFPRAHSWQRCSHAALSRFHSRSMIKKNSMTCSLALLHFCLHFQNVRVDALTYTHRIFMVKAQGAVGKNTPVKKQGNCWMEEIVNLYQKILRTGTKKNSLAHPCKSISSGNF